MTSSAPAPRSLADGTRHRVGTVGVDSGTMALATGAFPAEAYADGLRHGALVSGSGYGDGGYDVVDVVDANGARRGVEVVFFSPRIEAAAEERAVRELGRRPSHEERVAYYREAPMDDLVRRQIRAYLEAERELELAVWHERLLEVHPADDGPGEVLGEVEVQGFVDIGDPCYGTPSLTTELPPGRYRAVVWYGTGLGGYVCRSGLYRVEERAEDAA